MSIRKSFDTNGIDEKEIEVRADRLINFCQKHADLWYHFLQGDSYIQGKIKDSIEKECMLNLLRNLNVDYEYLVHAASKGSINWATITALRAANVGGNFGYCDEIQGLLIAYNDYIIRGTNTKDKSKAILRFKEMLIHRYSEYGSMELFKKSYVEALINHDDVELARMTEGLECFVKSLDVSQYDYVAKRKEEIFLNDSNLSNAMHRLRPLVYDGKMLELRLLEELPTDRRRLLNIYYNLDEPNQDFPASDSYAAKRYGISRQVMYQRLNHTIKQIRANLNNMDKAAINEFWLNSEYEEYFLRYYFEHHGIFTFSGHDGLNIDVRRNLKKIFDEGIKGIPIIKKNEIEIWYGVLEQLTKKLESEQAIVRREAGLFSDDRATLETNFGVQNCDKIMQFKKSANLPEWYANPLSQVKHILPFKTYNALMRAGVTSLGNLVSINNSELLQLDRIGPQALQGINKVQQEIIKRYETTDGLSSAAQSADEHSDEVTSTDTCMDSKTQKVVTDILALSIDEIKKLVYEKIDELQDGSSQLSDEEKSTLTEKYELITRILMQQEIVRNQIETMRRLRGMIK